MRLFSMNLLFECFHIDCSLFKIVGMLLIIVVALLISVFHVCIVCIATISACNKIAERFDFIMVLTDTLFHLPQV
jgi:hypothetical protein